MTQDEIIEMWNSVIKYAPSEVRITEFAKLVAAKERETCAQIAEQKISKTWAAPDSPKEWWEMACKNIAAAIRARGEA
jgi:hypothetical protein